MDDQIHIHIEVEIEETPSAIDVFITTFLRVISYWILGGLILSGIGLLFAV